VYPPDSSLRHFYDSGDGDDKDNDDDDDDDDEVILLFHNIST